MKRVVSRGNLLPVKKTADSALAGDSPDSIVRIAPGPWRMADTGHLFGEALFKIAAAKYTNYIEISW
jgi:hypothetical protein